MNDKFFQQAVKIRLDRDKNCLVAVTPKGEVIPLVENITIKSPQGDIVSATIDLLIDITDLKQHK